MTVGKANAGRPKALLVRRLAAAYIDFALPVYACIGIIYVLDAALRRLGSTADGLYAYLLLVVIPLIFAAILCKDLLRPSIGKRLMGLTVVCTDGSEISSWTLVRRNFSFFVWPVEVPTLLRTKGAQRLADRELGLMVTSRNRRLDKK